MSSKKKLVISLSVAAAVLVAAIIAIVAVFAAASQTVASNVKISYTASEVDGSISASYVVAGKGEAVQMGSASFTAGSDEITGTLNGASTEEIKLDATNNYVVFTYVFTNNGQKNMQISNTITTLDSNLKATYKILNVDDEYQDSLSSAILAGKANAADTAKEAKIEVRIDVTNKAFDIEEASMSFSWTMSSTTAQATIGVAQAG